MKTPNSLPVTVAHLTLANLHYSLFGDLLEGPLLTNMCGYTGLCYYGQYGQLLQAPSRFLIPLMPVYVSALIIIDDAGSGIGGMLKLLIPKIERMLGQIAGEMPETMDWLL